MRRFAAALALASLVASLSAASVAAFPSGPTTWFVDDDGLAGSSGCNGNQSVPADIQDAVNAAAPGDTVKVCPGTYVGTVDVATNNLTVSATQPWAATIKAPSDVGSALVLVHDARHVDLRWFNIVAGTTAPCATPNSLVSLSDAPFSRVRANHLGLDGAEGTDCRSFIVGINISDSPNSFVGGNHITDFSGVGIQEFGSNDTHIRGNTVRFMHSALPCCHYSDSVGILAGGFGTIIRGNVVRALATSGDTTAVLQVGINMFGDNDYAWQNVVRYANYGIQTISTQGVTIRQNKIRGVRVDGILLSGAYKESIYQNSVRAGAEGIFVSTLSFLNQIYQNDFRGPSDPDCIDYSSGAGTAGTDNFWTDNLGDTASPSGICNP